MSGEAPTPEHRLSATLLGMSQSDYGPSYREHSLEIYKAYLEMADRISGRREKANSFFLAVNTALVALMANNLLGRAGSSPETIEVLVPMAGGVLCYLWYRIISSYRDLNSAKFKVVHAIERQLPLRPYDAEWEAVERGRNPKLYVPFTHVEIFVPWVFMGFHAVSALSLVPWRLIWAQLGPAG